MFNFLFVRIAHPCSLFFIFQPTVPHHRHEARQHELVPTEPITVPTALSAGLVGHRPLQPLSPGVCRESTEQLCQQILVASDSFRRAHNAQDSQTFGYVTSVCGSIFSMSLSSTKNSIHSRSGFKNSTLASTSFSLLSPVTFTGQKKPLYFQENKARFAAFSHKIVHVVIPPMTWAKRRRQMKRWNITKREWAEEYHTRDIGLYMAIQMCRPQEGDWIFLSDIDELPRPAMLNALMTVSTPKEGDRNWISWT